MIPLWFLPYAIACGNTVVLKPSEKTPTTMARVLQLMETAGFPAGVVNLVHGGKEAVDALLDHPDVRAISFVGSTPVARYIYGARGGQRQARAVPGRRQESGRGPARRRHGHDHAHRGRLCVRLRRSALPGIVGRDHRGEAGKTFTQQISDAASARKVGYGLEQASKWDQSFPPRAATRVEGLIGKGIAEGARALVDGRQTRYAATKSGNFVRPTVLADVDPAAKSHRPRSSAPCLSVMHADSVEAAIDMVNRSAFGNMACLFTSSGSSARQFRYETRVGNVGINVGVAAPMAYFPFSGWKDSFFGDLHAQGRTPSISSLRRRSSSNAGRRRGAGNSSYSRLPRRRGLPPGSRGHGCGLAGTR